MKQKAAKPPQGIMDEMYALGQTLAPGLAPEPDDVRTTRPSTMAEAYAIAEMLKPSQRAFVKLCGKFPPDVSVWESYDEQFEALHLEFCSNWTHLDKNTFPPVLPYASSWKHGILGVYRQKEPSATVLRSSAIQVSKDLEKMLEGLKNSLGQQKQPSATLLRDFKIQACKDLEKILNGLRDGTHQQKQPPATFLKDSTFPEHRDIGKVLKEIRDDIYQQQLPSKTVLRDSAIQASKGLEEVLERLRNCVFQLKSMGMTVSRDSAAQTFQNIEKISNVLKDGINQLKEPPTTVARDFDIQASKELDKLLEASLNKSTGYFSPDNTSEVQSQGLTATVLNANRHFIDERVSFFERRPLLKNVHEAQKWCLGRLHDMWKQGKEGMSEDLQMVNTTESVNTTEGFSNNGGRTVVGIVTSIINRNPDQYYDWLRKDGQAL